MRIPAGRLRARAGRGLLPALACGGGLSSLGRGRARFRPAGAVRGDFFAGGVGEVVPQVPVVADLDRVGQGSADRFGVGGRSVPADGLDARMPGCPRSQVSTGAASRPGSISVRWPVSALMMLVAWLCRCRRVKSSTPITRGIRTVGTGTCRSSRRAGAYGTGTAGDRASRADVRPHNSLTSSKSGPVRCAVRRWQCSRSPGTCSRKVCRLQPRTGRTSRRILTRTTTCRPSTGTSRTVWP